MTVRDEIWCEILPILVADGRFTVSDLPFGEGDHETIRQVCQEMEDHGYLERCSDTRQGWRAGPRARRNLELTEKARIVADRDNYYWESPYTE